MSRPRRRGGYTLLEVLLVLLITSVLVTAVAAAINIYLRAVEAGRAEVEQAQLARALLRRIADDLRSAVPIVVDSSGGESLSSSAAAAATSAAQAGAAASAGGGSTSGGSGSGGGTSSTGGTSGVTNITGSTGVTNIGGSSGTGSSGASSGSGSSAGRSSGGTSGGSSAGSSGGASSGTPSSGTGSAGGSNSNSGSTSEDSTGEEEAVAAPPLGVYGSQSDLQIDVSRLPRTDRIDSLTGMIPPTDAASAGDPPSDVKTVSYYISTAGTAYYAADDSAAAAGLAPAGGLIRRQVDRSIVNFETLNGGAATDTNEQVLAPEATAIEFRYFDGTEWLTSWDSSDRQAVPVAVEIVLTMRTTPPTDAVGSTLLLGAGGLPEENTYRLLVHLPAGQASTAGAAALEEAMSSSTEAAP